MFCQYFWTQVLFELCPKHTAAAATSGDDRHLMIINASPLEYGHSLLVPSVNSCLPQVLLFIIVHCVWGRCEKKSGIEQDFMIYRHETKNRTRKVKLNIFDHSH